MLDKKLSLSQSILLYLVVVIIGYVLIHYSTGTLSSLIPHALE
jgi:uncharacterized membrane protein